MIRFQREESKDIPEMEVSSLNIQITLKLYLAKINLALKTEKNLLELRKNQIEDYIMAKRSVTLSENLLYLINPNALIIPDEMKIDIRMFLEHVK